MSNPSKVFISGKITRKTDKAVLMNGEWYPLSQVSVLQNGLMVPDWIIKKKSSQAKPVENVENIDIPSTPSTSSKQNVFNSDHLIECTIKLETPKAILVILNSNKKELWFPISQIKKAMDGETFLGIVPAEWLYLQKMKNGDIPTIIVNSNDGENPDHDNDDIF